MNCEHDIYDITCLGDAKFHGVCIKCDKRFVGPVVDGRWYRVPGHMWIEVVEKKTTDSIRVEMDGIVKIDGDNVKEAVVNNR